MACYDIGFLKISCSSTARSLQSYSNSGFNLMNQLSVSRVKEKLLRSFGGVRSRSDVLHFFMNAIGQN